MSPSFSPLSACLVLSVLINHSIPVCPVSKSQYTDADHAV